jgi:hypothetical protein
MESLSSILTCEAVSLLLFAWLQRRLLVRLITAEQQLRVYQRQVPRPRIKDRDRLFWALLSRVWKGWRSAVVIAKPSTVIRWQAKRFREYWQRKSKSGRPPIPIAHIKLIKRISREHPEYGCQKIADELREKLGFKYCAETVRKYMVKAEKTGGGNRRDTQTWRTFLKNQASAIWCCDFFVAHTVGLRALFVFVVQLRLRTLWRSRTQVRHDGNH